jgi:transcriptional regulator with XRE-family HTH domain
MTGSGYSKALGAKLRAIRQQQGLSLQGVEQKSQGRWKAVVVGSYERGDRSVTVAKLAELAEFYGVPLPELLPDSRASRSFSELPNKLVLDLERLSGLEDARAQPLARYAASIQAQRGDYNGRVLSIRQEDMRALAVIYDLPTAELSELMVHWGVINPDAALTWNDGQGQSPRTR